MRWTVGESEIVRVGDPGFDVVVPVEDEVRRRLARHPWLQPWAVTPHLDVVIGSSAFVVHHRDRVVVVDPFLVFDDPKATARRLTALRDAGADPDRVDLVVNSHVDGLGVNVLPDGSPAFPNATYVIPRAEIETIAAGEMAGAERWLDLVTAGRVEQVDAAIELAPGLEVRPAPGHNAGHVVTWVDGAAVMTGHLFLHPRQVADPDDVDEGEVAPDTLVATRRSLLEECAAGAVRLLAHLFPAPGGGVVRADGSGFRLEP